MSMFTDEEPVKDCGCERCEMRRYGRRLEEAAEAACLTWEAVPSKSLHEVRSSMRALRGVLGEPR